MQVIVDPQGNVQAHGEFPTPPPDPLQVALLADAEIPKLFQPGAKRLVGGALQVTPPTPPATRPKNLAELAQDLQTAQAALGTAQSAYAAAGTVALKADALRDAIVALAQGQRTLAKVVALLANDQVANT
ncbi:MAG TPA: hypothetical protein VK066_20655 [Chloroflexota bacterium]|nr:hypothetical protein [Chloroflexota bacterium]